MVCQIHLCGVSPLRNRVTNEGCPYVPAVLYSLEIEISKHFISIVIAWTQSGSVQKKLLLYNLTRKQTYMFSLLQCICRHDLEPLNAKSFSHGMFNAAKITFTPPWTQRKKKSLHRIEINFLLMFHLVVE